MLAVTGIGMVSALGLDAVTSCAAARAGICRIVEIDDLFVEDSNGAEVAKVGVHRVPRISAGLFGFSRLLRLGLAAIEDLVRSTPQPLDGRTGFVLIVDSGLYEEAYQRRKAEEATSDPPTGSADGRDAVTVAMRLRRDRITKELLDKLVTESHLAIDPKLRVTLAAGSVGFVSALRQAEEWLTQRDCDRCLVGGVDSLVDPSILAAIEGLRLLRTPNRAVGMFPGEAACFVALERPQDVKARGETAAAIVDGHGASKEPAHPLVEVSSAAGGGLRAAIGQAIASAPDQGAATALVIANLNGDPYRAMSWGRSVLPGSSPIRLGSLPLWVPPLHFGDVGAATGPVSLAMLVQGWARGYAARAGALVCLLDDAGTRAAVCLHSPEELAA